jgi:hypothetical protein
MACAVFHGLIEGSGAVPVAVHFLLDLEAGELACHWPELALQNE